MARSVIPQDYEEWRQCITVDCGLELNSSFIAARVASMKDESEHYTKQFIRSYGRQYHQTVLAWFIQAQETL